ncbi:MAG: polyhydroxyalkanoate depolymerase, partial [Planctomycetota bacterium]
MRRVAILFLTIVWWHGVSVAKELSIDTRLAIAGDNRGEIEKAINVAPPLQKEAMRFLVLHMPDDDLKTLSSEYLLENCRLAHEAISTAPWGDAVPREIFLNDVLPYASINERRDRWREDFRKRCLPLIKDVSSASRAAAKINQTLFADLGVRYSTKRKKADQSPHE